MTKTSGSSTSPERATFTPDAGPDKGKPITVHFNPASLDYTITNTLKNQGSSGTKKQYVSQSTGKLTMELIFDTTNSGQDVRKDTDKIAKFMEPDNKVPPTVLFQWGDYKFEGMVEAYKEKIDFFAPNGVPLRSTISLGMVSQEKVFDRGETGSSFAPDVAVLPPGLNADASSVAKDLGAPEAARAIASANGLESLRASAGVGLAIDASITLKGPEAFASGGAGLGLDLSAGLDIGVGASAGLSLDASIGGSASAGVSASAGAFAGLQTPADISGSVTLDLTGLAQSDVAAGFSTDASAGFALGGQATTEGSAGLGADVGQSADLRAQIEFEGD